MRTMIRPAVNAILIAWGIISALYILGEEDPLMPIGFVEFIGIKIASCLSLGLCVLMWKKFNNPKRWRE